MRSTLSDDRQDVGWWLASDGRWYPPDLHPAARPPVSGEQARIAALLDAAIGVARVRDNVFAQVHGDGPDGTSSSGDRGSAYSGAEYGSADDRDSGKGIGARHGADPLPRFRSTDRPNWPFETRSPSESVTSKTETRWRPEGRQRPDTRRPPSRLPSGLDGSAPAPPVLAGPPRATSAPAPPVPRWKHAKTPEPERPVDRGTSFAPVLTGSQVALSPPAPTAPPPAFTAPPSAPTAPPPAFTAPPPAPTAPPPTARRRPAPVRSPGDLRQAVAGAVARAAAQGPLIPRGSDESDAVAPRPSEPSTTWLDNDPATPPPAHGPSALVAPVESATDARDRPSPQMSPPARARRYLNPTKNLPGRAASMPWPVQPRGAAAPDR